MENKSNKTPIQCERPLIEPDRMHIEDLKVLLDVPFGSEITYTGFETELAVNNAAVLAQRNFSQRYLERSKRVSYKRITMPDNSLAIVMKIVNT